MKFTETSLPGKEDFHNHLNMGKYYWCRLVCKDFKIKNLGEYWDLYVQSDTLLLADVFNNFWICVLKYMGLIMLIFFSHQDKHGKQP